MAVPKLRFTGFDGDYLELSYDKFAPLQRGFDLPVSTIVEGDYPVVFSNGILKKHNEFKAQAPGVVTGRSGTIGNITWVEKDYWPHNTSLWVTNFFDNEPKYVFYFLQKFDVSRFASGSGVPTLNRNDVHAQLITISPERREQTKIASFLSAVDEKISQLTQKHQLLSQYKQGMMQKLFSQQLRFKADDGSEFGEWEEKILKDLFPKIRNGFVGVATPYYVNYGVKYLQGKNIKNGKIDATGLIFINQEFHQKKTNSTLKTNDILMVQSGHVGECAVVTEDYDNANCHALLVLSPKSSKLINSKFVVYYFYSEIGKKKIALIKTGNTIEHILASDIKEVALLFPCLAEQTKIANFLSAIDQKIEVVAQQIEQAKQWKKGLLQQMFV